MSILSAGAEGAGKFLAGGFKDLFKSGAKDAEKTAGKDAGKAAGKGTAKKVAGAGAVGAGAGYLASKGELGSTLDNIFGGTGELLKALSDWRVIAAIVLIVMAMFAR